MLIEGGSTGNVIGTDGDGVNDDAEGNLISGNITATGWRSAGPARPAIASPGTYIGTDLTGIQPVPNARRRGHHRTVRRQQSAIGTSPTPWSATSSPGTWQTGS